MRHFPTPKLFILTDDALEGTPILWEPGPAGTVVGEAVVEGTCLRVTLKTVGDPSDADGQELVVRVDVSGPAPLEASLRLSVSLGSEDPWFMIPGLFYGENRPVDCARVFPRFASTGMNPEVMVSNAWSFRSDRAATPAVFAWGDAEGLGFVIDETSALGATGVGFGHSDGRARIHADFPYQEGPVSYYGDARPRPAMVQRHTFVPGEGAEVRMVLHVLAADRHAFAPVLRSVWEQTRNDAPVEWVSPEQATLLAAEGLLRWHYDPDPGVLLETVGFDREITVGGAPVDRQAMHVGWISGLPWSYAMLVHALRTGNQELLAAAERVTDFVTVNLSPSGTFWGTWYRDRGWAQSWTPIRNGLHARTLGEATLFLVRTIVAVGADHPRHDDWAVAARSNLEAVANRQRADGNLGAVHDADTGEVLQWHGAAGLTWITAFLEATRAGLGDYRETAERAGAYYASFVERAFVHGAPEDVDLAPTSEDGYAAVMAFVALHRECGDGRWLDLAERAAHWMLSFRYTYDVDFPPTTMLGRYNFSTRGADQASPSNQHLHNYGLVCTKEMLELSAATGDNYYRERALESVACFRQFIARNDGDFNAYKGMVSERYYQTDCFQPKGMMLTLSHAWCVGVTLLGNEQVLDDASTAAAAP